MPTAARQSLVHAGRGRLAGGLPANFWKLWGSSAAANLADGIAAVAFPLIAVRLTTSPAEIAGIAIAFQAPMLVLGLVAGGLADRLDRRRTMLAVQLVRVGLMVVLTLLALTDGLSMPVLYLGAFVFGAGEAFFDTNAQSILPAVVGRERLVSANGRLMAAEMVMNSFVGPPLGGLLIAIAIPIAIGSSALGFALAAVGLFFMTGGFRAERAGPPRRLAVEIGEGITYLARHRLLLTLSTMVALGRFGSAGIFALLALYAVAPGPMGLSEPAYGLLLVCSGAGSIVGMLLVGRAVARLGRTGVLLASTLLFGLGILVPALTPNPFLVGAGSVVVGISIISWNVTNVSLRQAILPPALMGRVHATHRLLANTAGLAGAFVAGLLAEGLGLPVTFAVGSAIVLLGLFGGLVVTEERIRAAEAEAAGPAHEPVAESTPAA